LPRYVGTCKIMYEKILDTIHKSGLYDFICVAYSQPLFAIIVSFMEEQNF